MKRRRIPRFLRALTAGAGTSAVVFCRVAAADDVDTPRRTEARALFDDAMKFSAQGRLVPGSSGIAPASTGAPVLPVWSTTRRAGAGVAAGGVAGIVAGIALGVAASGQKGVIDAHCRLEGDVNHCDAEGEAAMDQAFALAHGANLTIAVGGLALGVGALLFFLGGESDSGSKSASAKGKGTTVSLVPVFAPGVGGLVIRGRY
jgi:hypothetical protein